MTESSFAAFVPQPVLDQIKAREDKWGKEHKTAEELEVIHGNTVWCVLRSGVDAPEDPANRFIIPKGKDIPVTNTYALASVLGGDNLQSTGVGKRFGVQLTDDSSLTFYNKTNQGHRPRPGITGFNVKTLDTWGMILEANINLKVWSRDDLDLMDMVYFKPGYPVLFEWGHTLYFNPDGSVCKNPKLMIGSSLFFQGGEFKDLDDLVYKARQQDCNREAVFGYITNFSWSFNNDGSFDCSLKVLSKGAVLESLRMGSNEEAQESTTKQDEKSWWKASDYHMLLKALNMSYEKKEGGQVGRVNSTPISAGESEYLKSLPGSRQIEKAEEIISIYRALYNASSDKHRDWDCAIDQSIWKDVFTPDNDCPAVAVAMSRGTNNRKIKCFYVTLQTLCRIINCFEQPHTPQFYLETTSTAKYGHEGFFYGDVEMPSINPLIAIKQSQIDYQDYKIDNQIKNCAHKNLESDFNEDNRILNIWVNYNVFVSLVENQIRSRNEYRLEPVLRELLASIQKAFGNINTFDLHAKQDITGYFEIVDRSYIKGSNPPVLNVSGLYNTVVDLKIQSDISQDIVNEMCIAATAPKESVPGAENADECLVFWGENCKARWYTKAEKNNSSSTTEKSAVETEKEAREQWVKRLKDFYKKIQNNKLGGSKREVNDDALEATDKLLQRVEDEATYLQVSGERYFKNQVKRDNENVSYLHMGIIPYKMSLTMLGISRLYIGNTFKIKNGILPKKYDNWGYIITGIEHSIRNNQWFTTLTTNYYPVFENEKETGYSTMVSPVANTVAEKPQDVDVEAIDDACGYVEAFTALRKSGMDYGYIGLCARYTSNWARTFVLGKTIPEKGLTKYYSESKKKTYTVPAIPAFGNANQSTYWTTLTSLGYKQGRTINMKMSDIRTLGSGKSVDGVAIKEGDVIAYGNASHQYGHTCFYDGRQWRSDADQKTAGVYSDDNIYWLILFSAPKRHSDWSCGAGA